MKERKQNRCGLHKWDSKWVFIFFIWRWVLFLFFAVFVLFRFVFNKPVVVKLGQ